MLREAGSSLLPVGILGVDGEFAAGDALLFNQMTLHRTAVDAATMTGERYAIESWFFPPSAYPTGQLPILY